MDMHSVNKNALAAMHVCDLAFVTIDLNYHWQTIWFSFVKMLNFSAKDLKKNKQSKYFAVRDREKFKVQ
jgi:hypothetical protein